MQHGKPYKIKHNEDSDKPEHICSSLVSLGIAKDPKHCHTGSEYSDRGCAVWSGSSLYAHHFIYFAVLLLSLYFNSSRDPNHPVDVQQYINTTWTEYEPVSQNYLDITPEMNYRSVRRRFAARALQFWSRLMPTLTRSH